MKNNRFSVLACMRAALALLLAIGMRTFLQPCVHADGAVGTCHWAGMVLAGLGVVLAVQAVLGMVCPSAQAREGIALATVPVALLTALIPGTWIPLCMLQTMRCNTIMKPAAILIAAVIGVLSVADAALWHRRAKQERRA